jgi:hypothetical protein
MVQAAALIAEPIALQLRFLRRCDFGHNTTTFARAD